MAISWLTARVKTTITELRVIWARAIQHQLNDHQGAEMSPDQWLEVLLPAIADNIGAVGGQADRYAEPQARPPAAAA